MRSLETKKVNMLGGLIILSVILTALLLIFWRADYERKAVPEAMSVIEYGGCEYVVVVRPGLYGNAVGLAHKGNCKYCTKKQAEFAAVVALTIMRGDAHNATPSAELND